MPSSSTPEAFLAHYGVKGMKWGQRKSDGSGKSLTVGQRLNRSKFGDISRKNVKKYNAQVKAAESGEETSRQKNLRKAVKVAEITGYVALIAGTAYAHHLLSQTSDAPVSTIRKPSPATQQSVLKVLGQNSKPQPRRTSRTSSKPFDMSSWNDPNYVWEL